MKTFADKFDAVYQGTRDLSSHKNLLPKAPAYKPTVLVSKLSSASPKALSRQSSTSEIGRFLVPTRSAKDLTHFGRYDSITFQKHF